MHFVTTMCDIVILVIANTFLCEKSLSLAFVLTMAVGCLVSFADKSWHSLLVCVSIVWDRDVGGGQQILLFSPRSAAV